MENAVHAVAQANAFGVQPMGHVQPARANVSVRCHALHVYANTVAVAADVLHAKGLGKNSAAPVPELAMEKESLQRNARNAMARAKLNFK